MRVYLHTFGCKANQYDTETVRQALEQQGATITDDIAAADAAVVNSCTVTQSGESKMRSLVRRLERANPNINTVVMGCAAALDDGTISSLPGVNRVVGGPDTAGVLEALDFEPAVESVLKAFHGGSRAWVKIQDGCDEHCTFCATTVARGGNRSRHPDEIVEETAGLADGHQEMVLTGVHIGTYGRDLGDISLSALVERLITSVPGVRFRLTSVEATEVDDRLIDLMVSCPDRLAPHLHAPLQSGSDRVLKRMGRHWYTAQSYRARCEHMAELMPVFGLGADVIVGFPGETDDDHAQTMSLVEALPFTYLHVFPYSERPDASAKRLGPPVHGATVHNRTRELRDLAASKAQGYRQARRPEADIVTLGRHRGRYRGLTEDFLDVTFSAEETAPARFEALVSWDEAGVAQVEQAEVAL